MGQGAPGHGVFRRVPSRTAEAPPLQSTRAGQGACCLVDQGSERAATPALPPRGRLRYWIEPGNSDCQTVAGAGDSGVRTPCLGLIADGPGALGMALVRGVATGRAFRGAPGAALSPSPPPSSLVPESIAIAPGAASCVAPGNAGALLSAASSEEFEP